MDMEEEDGAVGGHGQDQPFLQATHMLDPVGVGGDLTRSIKTHLAELFMPGKFTGGKPHQHLQKRI